MCLSFLEHYNEHLFLFQPKSHHLKLHVEKESCGIGVAHFIKLFYQWITLE